MTMNERVCTDFCRVCRHGIYNIERHLQTAGHRLRVRREAGLGYNPSGPRLPGQARGSGNEPSPFSGHLVRNLHRRKL
jgi:hypothetical protein